MNGPICRVLVTAFSQCGHATSEHDANGCAACRREGIGTGVSFGPSKGAGCNHRFSDSPDRVVESRRTA